MTPGRRTGDLDSIARILREARCCRGHVAAIFALGLLAAPLALLQPVPLKLAVDNVLGGRPLPAFLHSLFGDGREGYGAGLLLAVAVLQVLVVLLSQLRSLAARLLETRATERITLRMRAKLLDQAQRLSFAFHDRRGTADSIYRIQYDATGVASIAVTGLPSLATSTLTLVSMVWVMLAIHVELALVALAIVPLLFVIAQRFRTVMRPRYKEAKQLESSALGVVQEVLSAFRIVKAFGREQHEKDRFVHHSAKGADARLRLGVAEGVFALLVAVTTSMGTAAVLFVGGRSVQQGSLTLGELLMVIAYLGQLYGPIHTLSKKLANAQKHLVSSQRAFDLLDRTPEVAERPGARPLHRARGDVEFRDVSFAYEGGAPVLRGVSFEVRAGTRVGIVGRTGAGKTTLVSLLTRFYDPGSGVILLDGVDLRDLRLADLRAQFSIVLQDAVLFSTTIADNIAYARPDATTDEVVAAAIAAGAHEFVTELPDGYDTVVGERGMRLSGGERQRISLARAFLKDAPILILDEPTSSVDVHTEAAIMATMQRLMEGRTTFMIAHRLGTLAGCDLLLRVVDGRVEPTSLEVAGTVSGTTAKGRLA